MVQRGAPGVEKECAGYLDEHWYRSLPKNQTRVAQPLDTSHGSSKCGKNKGWSDVIVRDGFGPVVVNVSGDGRRIHVCRHAQARRWMTQPLISYQMSCI